MAYIYRICFRCEVFIESTRSRYVNKGLDGKCFGKPGFDSRQLHKKFYPHVTYFLYIQGVDLLIAVRGEKMYKALNREQAKFSPTLATLTNFKPLVLC